MSKSFALGDHFERFIDEQLKKGRYNNASEVVRSALRLLEDREAPPALTLEELRALIREGRESGPGKPADEVLARVRARIDGGASDTNAP